MKHRHKYHHDPATNTVKKGKFGVAPGTLIYTGREDAAPVRISVIEFNEEEYHSFEVQKVSELRAKLTPGMLHWINIDGVHNVDLVRKISEQFDIHPLVQEDIVNTHQRAKVEDYKSFVYFVIRMAEARGKEEELYLEQVSILLGQDYIISFQEDEGDIWDPVRHRIETKQGKIREMKMDYLAYLLLDAVVDNYFIILEKAGNRIDKLEQKLLGDPEKESLNDIYDLKRQFITLRKSVWPLRETINTIQRLDNPLISREIHLYYQDLYDHVMRVMDSVESNRDIATSMIDQYLSISSMRMNEVMKVLTIISTLFIPMTFITGLYGMNLDYMPEIHSPWAYPIVIGIMGLMVMGQLWWFRKKRWL